LRDRIDEIRNAGAELVIVGSGSAYFARAFREDMNLDCRVLVDPELDAFRAAGLRRGKLEILSPMVPINALRALARGARQQSVQGDPWQLGGTFVIRPGGLVAFSHASRQAGDHPDLDGMVAALQNAGARASSETEGSGHPMLAALLGMVVDPTIVFSFDRTGYRIHSLGFDPHDLDVDASDRHCVITGGNSGLGFEAAVALAELGARVTLLCRDLGRADAAVERIRDLTGNERVGAVQTDLADLQSVYATAAQLADETIDVLIHNAGVLPAERILSPDGLELTHATHVIGPHVLTRALLPALERAPAARVIFVTSGGMYAKRLQLDDPDWSERDYDGVAAYAETKRAQVVLTELWAEHLAGSPISVNAMHPGWADTPGVQSSLPTFRMLTKAILRTPAEGADTIVWLAASQAAADYNGELFFDRKPRWKHILPFTAETQAERAELWRRCEQFAAHSKRSFDLPRVVAGAPAPS
jgi:NAD(P)-dependent dehydrogenase (short-subunit alcohol dehydrogenase family)